MIQQLADLVVTLMETANIHAAVLENIAGQMESLRSTLVDTVASRDQEQAKRNLIAEMDLAMENLRNVVSMIERGPVDRETLAREIREALCLRVKELAGAAALSEVVEILSERSNNIAMAYAGRVVREQE